MPVVDELSGLNAPSRSMHALRWGSLLLFESIYLCFSPVVLAQTLDGPVHDSDSSWTATTDSKAASGNPTRTFESHIQSGGRTVDVRSLQTRGPDGNFTPYQDIETETVRVNARTVQITTRTFVRDGNGAKTLFQVTEEAKEALPGGDSRTVRTTSNPDADGNLQVARREVQESQNISPGVEDTKTTVMLNDVNGGLAPAMQTQERQKRSGNTVETQTTTLLANGSGGWEVGETRQATIKDDGKNVTREERVSRPDADGRLQEVTHTIARESEDLSGEKRSSEEIDSIDIPGVGRDGGLHLARRVTTRQLSNSGDQQATRRVEQPNPGDPSASLRVTAVNTDSVRLGPFGAQATRTIQVRDANGSLGVVSVDMSKSNDSRAIEVQIAPNPK